jgi:hypothetical protein
VLKVTEIAVNSFPNPDWKIDLGKGRLAMDYTDAGDPNPQANFTTAIRAARQNNWTGNGITSSVLSTPEGAGKGIGWGEASVVLGENGGNWGGVPVDGTTMLARYTLLGDVNLDGTVDFNDLAKLAQNYNNLDGSRVWTDGDFTYEGAVDFNDLAAMAQNYNSSLPAAAELAAVGASAAFQEDLARAFAQVPEPGGLGIVLLSACGFARRRRRDR